MCDKGHRTVVPLRSTGRASSTNTRIQEAQYLVDYRWVTLAVNASDAKEMALAYAGSFPSRFTIGHALGQAKAQWAKRIKNGRLCRHSWTQNKNPQCYELSFQNSSCCWPQLFRWRSHVVSPTIPNKSSVVLQFHFEVLKCKWSINTDKPLPCFTHWTLDVWPQHDFRVSSPSSV